MLCAVYLFASFKEEKAVKLPKIWERCWHCLYKKYKQSEQHLYIATNWRFVSCQYCSSDVAFRPVGLIMLWGPRLHLLGKNRWKNNWYQKMGSVCLPQIGILQYISPNKSKITFISLTGLDLQSGRGNPRYTTLVGRFWNANYSNGALFCRLSCIFLHIFLDLNTSIFLPVLRLLLHFATILSTEKRFFQFKKGLGAFKSYHTMSYQPNYLDRYRFRDKRKLKKCLVRYRL